MKWLDDKPSADFTQKVMRAAELELAKHRSSTGERRWFLKWAGAAALGLAGIFAYRQMSVEKPAMDVAENDPEMLSELSLLEDLELWRNLDQIEAWKKEGA
jgi:hypothetical protein